MGRKFTIPTIAAKAKMDEKERTRLNRKMARWDREFKEFFKSDRWQQWLDLPLEEKQKRIAQRMLDNGVSKEKVEEIKALWAQGFVIDVLKPNRFEKRRKIIPSKEED